jgi:hypothetical protein
MASYEAIDLAEMAAESVRVNSKGPTQENNNIYVRMPSGQGTGEGNSFITIRFLPRRKGEHLFCATKYHSLKDSNGNRKILFSPKKLTKTDKGDYRWTGDNTVIDKYLRDLWAKSDKVSGKAQEDLRNQYRELKGIERYYYNVIVRQEKDSKTGEVIKNVGPKILSCGKTIHGQIMRAIVGDEAAGEEPLGDITNPKTGRDFKLVKKNVKGANGAEYPNYDQSKFLDPIALGTPEEVEKWIENLHDLQSIRVIKTEEELKHALKIHLGLITENDDDDDDYDASEFSVKSNSKNESKKELIEDQKEKVAISAEEEEIMADDDFLKEIDGL